MEIIVKNVTRKYRDKEALKDFNWNLEINHELVHGLIGPNGAGKTTILKILAGIYTYESGEILIPEMDCNYEIWARENIAFLAAGDRGIRYRNTVYENALYYGALKAIEPKITNELFDKYSKILRIEDFRNRQAGFLSTGEKKKAMLLSALSSGSKVIILDEPSNGLDISGKIDLQNIIKYISKETDTCFIISTHDLDFISGLANYYTFISKGKIAYEEKGYMEIEKIRDKFLEINRTIPDYGEM